MSEKRAKSKTSKKSAIALLCDALKCDAETLKKIAESEKRLMTLKAEKKSKEQKVERQRARNLSFYRHEHTAETIARLQAYAKSL